MLRMRVISNNTIYSKGQKYRHTYRDKKIITVMKTRNIYEYYQNKKRI